MAIYLASQVVFESTWKLYKTNITLINFEDFGVCGINGFDKITLFQAIK